MIMTFNGDSLLEPDTDWAGPDGLHDAWLQERPDVDFTRMGLSRQNGQCGRGPSDKTTEEAGFFQLRAKLVEHYDYRVRHNEVAWLRS